MKHLLHKLSSLRLLTLLAVLLGMGSSAAWADSYKLVKSASELSQNDIILITSGKDGAVKALGPQTGNNCPAKDITISSETITDKGDAQEIVFDKTDVNGYFTFNVGTDLYLYAASSSSNHLKTQASGAYWKILIDGSSYAATITDQSHQNNRNLLKYNSSSKLFSCYSSGQADVFIFKKVVITPAYTITAQSNNVDYGTVSISGSTITATPAAGYRYASSAYTVSPANSATVSQNGNEFSVTPSENTTVTINFEAIPTHTATFSINGNTDNTANFAEGADIIFPNAPADIDGKTFVGWVTSTIDGTTDEAPTFVTSATMGTSDVIYYAVFAYASGGGSSEVVDVLNYEWAGVTGTNYSSWSDNTATSSAVYAGNTAGGNDAIQLRSNNNNSGIVTTTSGGKATKVTVEWNSKTSAGRTLNVYGKNSAYSTASDLYNSSNQGTLLGTIVYETSTELTIDGDYEYIGIRSASGALYLDEVQITWSTGGGVSYSDYCTTVAAETVARPTIEVAANPFLFSTTATITCVTEDATIYYSFDEEDWTEYTGELKITSATTLYAKAVKDENESTVASVEITKNLAVPTVAIDAEGITNTNVFTSTEAGSLAAAVTYNDAAVEGATVTWSGDNDEVATIDDETGAVTLVAAGTVTFTATYAGNSDYSEKTASYVMTVTNQDPNAPGTENNPYTVAEAIDAIDNDGDVTDVYVAGIVSQVDSYNSTYHSITYWISEDGTTTSQQFEVYSGKDIDGADFSSKDDIQVGDIVVIKGNITYYSKSSVYEFSSNNQLVSLSRKPAATITVEGGTEFNIDRENNEEELQLTATANSGATVVFTVDTENTTLDAGNYEFEDGLLLVSGNTAGVIVIKANAPATGNYNAATEVTITVNILGVKSDATIVVKNDNVAYGSTYTIDDSMIEGGDITVTSSNESVATVSGLTITPAAVGTTTITVSTAENAEYKAGSETFELTVTAPEGKTTAVAGGFVKVTSTEDITDGQYLIVYEDGGVAFDGSLETLDAVGNTIEVTINESKIDASDATKAAVFTIDAKAGTIQSASGFYIGQTSYANGLATSEEESYAHSFEIDNDGNANISMEVNSNNVSLRYNKASNQTRFRYYKSGQETIQLYKLNEANLTATLNATTGYATYCSAYPLDFSATKGYSAWQITDIKGTTISFDKVTGSVKGGTGLFLKGTPGATVTLTSVDSENTLDENLLEGTLAPTYVTEDEYYGLKGDNFVKVNSGIIPAGKAILDADWIETSAGEVKAFTFIFNDVTTGVRTIETVSAEEAAKIFNLAGQRVDGSRFKVNGSGLKTGIYIVNGKKVLVK